MNHKKVTSVLLSAAMCASMVVTPVMADETVAPTEAQNTEATEKQEPEVTEKKETKAAEKKETEETTAKETEAPETKEVEETKAAEEQNPEETEASEEKKPEETEAAEEQKPEETEAPEEQKPEEAETAEEKQGDEETANRPSVNANSGKCGEYVTWSLSGTTLTITGKGSMTSFSEFDGQSAENKVFAPWTLQAASITKVIISGTVTTVGSYSFKGFTSLTSVSFPESMKAIGKNSFEDCEKLTSITYPAKLESISDSAFKNCKSLSSIVIPNTVTKVGMGAFEGCTSLTSATLSNKRRQGLWVGAFTPFGYVKDPKNRNHLIIDEEAANTVRYIFRLYLNGMGVNSKNHLLTSIKHS